MPKPKDAILSADRFTVKLNENHRRVLGPLSEEDCSAYCQSAFDIGMRALEVARGSVDAAAVKEQLASALSQLETQLLTFTNNLGRKLELSDTGRAGMDKAAQEKMDRILSAQLVEYRESLMAGIDKHVKDAAEPLAQLLNPNSRNGTVALLGDTVQKALNAMADRIKNEVLSQFSRDSSGSAMSRLEGIIQTSHGAIVKQFSMDDPNSALRRLHESIGQRVEALASNQAEFQTEIRSALAAMTAKKAAEEASTTHGKVYEEALIDTLGAIARRHGHSLDAIGNSTGLIRSCKVGDGLIRLSDDCAAPGALIVVEAKSAGGYDTVKILAEAELARKNRGAQFTIFVIDPQYCPAAWPAVNRYGETIVVKWAQEDPEINLFAAFSIACALVVKTAKQGQKSAVDWSKMEKATLEVQKRVEQLADVETWTTTISSSATKIMDRMRIAREALTTQVEVLMDQIKGLKGEE